MPRPDGRRWARLRRSGSRATNVLARVTRRRGQSQSSLSGTQIVYPRPDRPWRRDRGSATTVALAAAGLAPRGPAAAGQAAQVGAGQGLHRPSADRTAAMSTVTSGPQTSTVAVSLLPGEQTMARRVKFAIANGCTVASLVLGMVAVFVAIGGQFHVAAVALLACVVFDGCDGGLARRFDVASPFGAQMDSLADLSSFGVATGIVVFEWMASRSAPVYLAGPICALIAVCAAIRLARFNVSPKDGRFFSGVPTTMVAAVLALDILIGPHLSNLTQLLGVLACAAAMVTSFPYAKLVKVLRMPLWLWVVPAICAMISLPATFALVVGGYVLSGPVLWLYHNRRPAAAL